MKPKWCRQYFLSNKEPNWWFCNTTGKWNKTLDFSKGSGYSSTQIFRYKSRALQQLDKVKNLGTGFYVEEYKISLKGEDSGCRYLTGTWTITN